jgi:hypothetical protein
VALGLSAQVPGRNGGLAEAQDHSRTLIQVYNGAGARIPETLEYLEELFGVTAQALTDPTVTVDVIITTGRDMPVLE